MEKVLLKDSISFQTEGRLLQELGLRLVASPEVALVELIKNAFDADSPTCVVALEDKGKTLVVSDAGSGMTFADFRSRWMRIATAGKVAQEFSSRFGRRLTGAKGIGRFAVRFLGDHLTLESVAYDSGRDCLTRLTVGFDWPELDKKSDISEGLVHYQLTRAPKGTSSGTTLTIRQLRTSTDFARSLDLRNNVIRIVSPLQGLDPGQFAERTSLNGADPGFKVVLPGGDGGQDVDLASLILDNSWARLTITLIGRALVYRVSFAGQKGSKVMKARVVTTISQGFSADIRFFPRRKGIFQDKGVGGRRAWGWVRANCGIAVVDHGFRIKPYGFPNDDWLQLDIDKAHSERDWKSTIARERFPVAAAVKNSPADNPVLNMPYNLQLVGAVFIRSQSGDSSSGAPDLVPAMDREGLLRNEALEQLREFVRGGIEFLANQDKMELERRAEERAREAARTAREDIREAIDFIQQSTTLTRADKSRITSRYRRLADQLEEQEEYSVQARKSLLTMSLLGVVAGFMTHESKAAVDDLEKAAEQVESLARKHPSLQEAADDLRERIANFYGYLDYARLFVQKVRAPKEEELSAAGQVRHVLKHFKAFATDRGIEVTQNISSDIKTPPLPVAVYSGVLLNLYTNALKAVIAVGASIQNPQVSLFAWNETGKHIVEVADNGIGIPPGVRKRIWEPLYTTTSDIGNPLGSGMGLGLTLIKQVMTELGGTVVLVSDPPPGYTTCFRLTFPNKQIL